MNFTSQEQRRAIFANLRRRAGQAYYHPASRQALRYGVGTYAAHIGASLAGRHAVRLMKRVRERGVVKRAARSVYTNLSRQIFPKLPQNALHLLEQAAASQENVKNAYRVARGARALGKAAFFAIPVIGGIQVARTIHARRKLLKRAQTVRAPVPVTVITHSPSKPKTTIVPI